MSASTKLALGGLFLFFPLYLKSQNLNQFIQLLPAENGLIFGVNKRTTIQSLVSRTEGLYILTAKDGCYLLSGESMSELKLLSVPKDRRDLFARLLATEQSVLIWANQREFLNLDEPAAARITYVGSHFNNAITATDIDIDRHGRIFVATAHDGLFIFRKGNDGNYINVPLRISTIDQQLPSNNVNCLYRDEDDVLWIGTTKGVSTMRDNIITNLSVAKEVKKPTFWRRLLGIPTTGTSFQESIQCITSWGDCILLINTDGLYKADRRHDELTKLYKYSLSNALTTPLQSISAVLVDIDDNIWLAGDQLLKYDLPQNRLYNVSENMPFYGRNFLTITEDVSAGSIWIGMERGGLYEYYDDGQQRPISFISLQTSSL
jgi:ligand-binding sensor domain-containing protein